MVLAQKQANCTREGIAHLACELIQTLKEAEFLLRPYFLTHFSDMWNEKSNKLRHSRVSAMVNWWTAYSGNSILALMFEDGSEMTHNGYRGSCHPQQHCYSWSTNGLRHPTWVGTHPHLVWFFFFFFIKCWTWLTWLKCCSTSGTITLCWLLSAA